MKAFLLATIFLLTSTFGFSQKNLFTLNSYVGKANVQINGKKYSVDSTGAAIPTNYPKFDTLIFLTPDSNSVHRILCNFKPDSLYWVTMACCGMLDIVKTKPKNDSLQYWNWPKDADKIRSYEMDKPFISIRTKSTPRDSIYAYHADAACKTEYKMINTELWRLGIPPKCFYWSNITTIQFFKTVKGLAEHEETDLEEFLIIDNIVELTSISFRLFDDQRFVITYDEVSNTAVLEYE